MQNLISIKTASDGSLIVFGEPSKHPELFICDFNKAVNPIPKEIKLKLNVYKIFYNRDPRLTVKYGKDEYKLKPGKANLMFFAPGQICQFSLTESVEKFDAIFLNFHPDLIRNSFLKEKIKTHSFFNYSADEGLFVENDFEDKMLTIFEKINDEIDNMDYLSNDILISYIDLLLNYCSRLYQNQFGTISRGVGGVLAKFENCFHNYYDKKEQLEIGLPSVSHIAEKMNLTPSYLSDFLKKETGKGALDNIQFYLMEMAKDKLIENNGKNISEIAFELGFEYPQYFTRLFKKKIGVSPSKFINSTNIT